jgi:predicted RNA-binding protein with PIN domain
VQNCKHYIVDGNNLIGKDKALSKIQRTDMAGARKSALALLETFLHENKVRISCHFDGHPDDTIKARGIQINYSFKKEADYFIKKEIDSIINKNNVVVVTSDSNVAQYARISGCSVVSSEEFIRGLRGGKRIDKEEEKIRQINNVDEFKRLFGV